MVQIKARLLSLAQVAELLQLAVDKVGWLADTGQLVQIPIAGEVRFDARDVERLVSDYRRVQENKRGRRVNGNID